jgi:hypothetical protein
MTVMITAAIADFVDSSPFRLKCCRETLTSASVSKVTRVRALPFPSALLAAPSLMPERSYALFFSPFVLVLTHMSLEGAGTVYFTSIRKARGEPFTTRAYHISLPPLFPRPLSSPPTHLSQYELTCPEQCVSRSSQTTALLFSCHGRR